MEHCIFALSGYYDGNEPRTRVDVDNIAKWIIDSLRGIVYADDQIIVKCAGEKSKHIVVLTTDLPEYGLHAGDIGTVVLVHHQGAGYEVECMTLDGETIAVVTLAAVQVQPVVQ